MVPNLKNRKFDSDFSSIGTVLKLKSKMKPERNGSSVGFNSSYGFLEKLQLGFACASMVQFSFFSIS